MAWITPKLDWTMFDYINASDMNRIENNIAEVAAFLNSIQYTIPAMTHVTNRTITYVDFLTGINRIEKNLETIRTNFLTPLGYLGTRNWVTKQGFSFEDAIRLEKNVAQLMEYGILVTDSRRFCGTFNCGEDWGNL